MNLFGSRTPQPQPIPVMPNDDVQRQRQADAARDALLSRQTRGRAATDFAGSEMAEQSQMERGLLRRQQRSAAASGLLG